MEFIASQNYLFTLSSPHMTADFEKDTWLLSSLTQPMMTLFSHQHRKLRQPCWNSHATSSIGTTAHGHTLHSRNQLRIAPEIRPYRATSDLESIYKAFHNNNLENKESTKVRVFMLSTRNLKRMRHRVVHFVHFVLTKTKSYRIGRIG